MLVHEKLSLCGANTKLVANVALDPKGIVEKI